MSIFWSVHVSQYGFLSKQPDLPSGKSILLLSIPTMTFLNTTVKRKTTIESVQSENLHQGCSSTGGGDNFTREVYRRVIKKFSSFLAYMTTACKISIEFVHPFQSYAGDSQKNIQKTTSLAEIAEVMTHSKLLTFVEVDNNFNRKLYSGQR